jgi:hypothetical protein
MISPSSGQVAHEQSKKADNLASLLIIEPSNRTRSRKANRKKGSLVKSALKWPEFHDDSETKKRSPKKLSVCENQTWIKNSVLGLAEMALRFGGPGRVTSNYDPTATSSESKRLVCHH